MNELELYQLAVTFSDYFIVYMQISASKYVFFIHKYPGRKALYTHKSQTYFLCFAKFILKQI